METYLPEHSDANLLFMETASSYLNVCVLRRQFPDSTDYWDGNWLTTRIELKVKGFEGDVLGQLRADEFDRFAVEVRNLYETLRGSAQFKTMERWLDILMTGDGLGDIEIICSVRNQPGVGDELKMSLRTDQTGLPPLLDSLGAIAVRYPIVGRGSILVRF